MIVILLLLLGIAVLYVPGIPVSSNDGGLDVGTFWQLTDIHYDANYSQEGSTKSMCHMVSQVLSDVDRQHDNHQKPSVGPGPFGDHACDSPWALVKSAIATMKKIQLSPDFILWTGDTVAHIPDSQIDLPKVFSLVRNTTQLLKQEFNSTPIYPSLGNHDVWPVNQIPANGSSPYFDSILTTSGWDQLLDHVSQNTFKRGGYHSAGSPFGLKVVALNSVLWYDMDLTVHSTDPASQFKWLEDLLQQARKDKQKMLLTGHVPPGVLARSPANMTWFLPTFNKKFAELIVQYSDVISATIFGHEHTDSFRISCHNGGHGCIPMFLAPAVTPFKSTVPGLGSNNPAIRLYKYNRTTGDILDFFQYYIDLNSANIKRKADWTLEYQATESYGIKDVSGEELKKLVQKFCDDVGNVFQKYFKFNSVSYEDRICDDSCRKRHVCAISNVQYPDFYKCLDSEDSYTYKSGDFRNNKKDEEYSETDNFVPGYIYVTICSSVVLVMLMFGTITFLCCRSQFTYYFRQSGYTSLR